MKRLPLPPSPTLPPTLAHALCSAAVAALVACGGGDAADDPPAVRGGAAGRNQAGAGASGGGQDPAPEPGAAVALPLVVDDVSWNTKQADVGNVQIALETPSATLLFGSRGLLVLAGGVIASSDDTATDFRDAAAVARTTDTRVLAVTGSGDVLEVADGDSLVAARDRLGLTGREVFWVRDAGGRAVFGLAEGIAVADSGQTGFFDLGPLSAVATESNRLAGLTPDGARVRVFDLVGGTLLEYPLPGVTAVAWDENLVPPRLLAAVGKTLYRADAAGNLVAAFEAPAAFAALASAPSGSSPRRTWGLVGSELAQVDTAAISITSGAALTGGRLFGSATGAWITSPSAPPRRLALHAASPEEDQWNKQVQPAFARSCTPCHLPGGSADADLSTYARWVELRDKIRKKVFGAGTVVPSMPPAGYPLSDTDRAAIETFTTGNDSAAGAGGAGGTGAGGTAGSSGKAGSGGKAGAGAGGSANQ
jgi:hypothetical protein